MSLWHNLQARVGHAGAPRPRVVGDEVAAGAIGGDVRVWDGLEVEHAWPSKSTNAKPSLPPPCSSR